MTPPFLIGIAGRTCSGKSGLCQALVKMHPEKILHLEQDLFFKKDPPMLALNRPNLEMPESLHMDRLYEMLCSFKRGESAKIPSRGMTSVFDRVVAPMPIVLVDGFLLYQDPRLCAAFDLKVWIEIDDDTILERRLKRMRHHDTVAYLHDTVVPLSHAYEQVQRHAADLILDGNHAARHLAQKLDAYLKEQRIL